MAFCKLIKMKPKYYPLVIWSLLYIVTSFLVQGAIGIYGTAFANIRELG